jgi:GNAT superfamily N-acetyltransferase
MSPGSIMRRDLDLAAVTPEGAIAAFCTIWFDDVTRSAYFEPVATVPSHQRQGLGKALMTGGLCRLQRMGATTAFVSGYSRRANALEWGRQQTGHRQNARLLSLANREILKKWTILIPHWPLILNQLVIRFEEQMPI